MKILKFAAIITLVLFAACVEMEAGPDTESLELADPSAPLPGEPAAATACTTPIQTEVWIRYWSGGTEIPCSQVAAAGHSIQVGQLGGAYTIPVTQTFCTSAVQTNPALRVGTGVIVFTAQPGLNHQVRLNGPNGPSQATTTPVRTGGGCASAFEMMSVVVPPNSVAIGP